MKPKISNNLIIAILIPLAVGVFSALFTSNAMQSYTMVNKPPLSPPAFLFPIVWTILYILMGISSYLVYSSNDPGREKAILYYGVQLFFNFCWSFLFFNLSAYLTAFLWLVIMILVIVLMILAFYRINKTAGLLQIPYLIWCLFAAYLNLAVYLLN